MPVERDKKRGRFIVQRDEAAGFRVIDTREKRAVDGPFRDRDDAEARAAKRELRDS